MTFKNSLVLRPFTARVLVITVVLSQSFIMGKKRTLENAASSEDAEAGPSKVRKVPAINEKRLVRIEHCTSWYACDMLWIPIHVYLNLSFTLKQRCV